MAKNRSTEQELEDVKSRYDRLAGFLVAAVVGIVLLLAVLSVQNTELWQTLSGLSLSSTFFVILAFVGVFPVSYIAYQIRRKEIKIKRLSHEFRLLGLIKGVTEEEEVRQLYDRAYNWGQYVLFISLIILVSVIILLLYAPLSPLSRSAVGSELASGLPVVLPTGASPGSRGTAASTAPFPPIKAATSVTTTAAISPTQPITLVQSIATSRAITTSQQITLTSALTTTVAISPSQSVTLTSTVTTVAPLPSQPTIPTNRHVVSLVFFAFLGAYVYSVMEVIRRYNTFDLQPQVYASILVRMVAAVVLVFVGALTIFNSPSTYQPPDPAPGYATIWLPAIIAFVIGAFPSSGLDWFRRLADPVLTGRTAATPAALPIENLLGVSTWHASRLEQIGIDDAQNLAGADLAELLLTTSFDAQVIVNWVDQAILYTKVGPAIEAYRKKNITSFSGLRKAVAHVKRLPQSSDASVLQDKLATQLGLQNFAELEFLAADAGFPNYYNLEAYYSRAPLVTSSFAEEAQNEIIGKLEGIFTSRSPDEAVKLGTKLLKAQEGNPDIGVLRNLGIAYYKRAMSHMALRQLSEASDDFKEAIDCFSKVREREDASTIDRALALHGRSMCWLEKPPEEGKEKQQWQDAVTDSTQAILLDRAFAAAFTTRAMVYYRKLGSPELAKQDLDEALRLDDRLAEAYYNRGVLLVDDVWAGADARQAISDFEKAHLSGYGDEGGIKLGLGTAKLRLGGSDDLKAAAQDLTQASGLVEESRLAETYLKRATACARLGQIDNAVSDIDWIVKRGQVADGLLAKAKAVLEEIVTRDPDFSSEATKRAYKILVKLRVLPDIGSTPDSTQPQGAN